MSSLGLGIIGLGVGKRYAERARSVGFDYLAICDVSEEKLQAGARELSAEWTGADCRDLLALPEVDAVVIATPDALHQEMAVRAAQAGKHVLCETPLALRRPSAELIVDATLEAGVHLMAAHRLRFHPLVQRFREELSRIGEIGLFEARWVRSAADAPTGWRLDPKLKRNLAIGEAVDVVDAVRWMMGDLYEITGFTTKRFFPDWPVGDTVMSAGRFLSKAGVNVLLSVGGEGPASTRLTARGARGTLVVDLEDGELSLATGEGWELLAVQDPDFDPEGEILKAFHALLTDGAPNPCNVGEAANAVVTAIAISDSAEVNLPARVRPLEFEAA
ncbi:MAG: Gfo/Idh/MocA family oxidoreductase [Calditrichaeota bacterium]|nr:Gfo/Idh/MocA family oxidoreductase [Calditrichota bacterium]